MIPSIPYKKKRLGQHFLHDKNIAKKITNSLTLAGKQYGTLIEIGPGEGMLSQYLKDKNLELYLIEVDKELIPALTINFPELRNHIINEDFLKFNLEKINASQMGIIGNFPYNISSQIVFKIIENRLRIPEMVGMFQKEMAERICAHPHSKTYGIISVLAQAFYDTNKLFNVPKTVFIPPPNVESQVIRMIRKHPAELECNENLFFKVVKLAFSQRRKKLRNTLKPLLTDINRFDTSILDKRAEMLSLSEFITLTKQIGETNIK